MQELVEKNGFAFVPDVFDAQEVYRPSGDWHWTGILV
jgi:hypothetical protein